MSKQWPEKKRISIVVDQPSWFDAYAEQLKNQLLTFGHDTSVVRNANEVEVGDIAFYLACVKITPNEILKRNYWNLVVHESELPKGRGFAPLTWAMLEGRREVDSCLILATDGAVDSGPILLRQTMRFTGYELGPEIRRIQAETTIALCLNFVNARTPPIASPQVGEPTFFRRRYPNDSELDPSKSIEEQFNLLRVVDNERYPAFFEINGNRYVLKIYRSENIGTSKNE